MAVLFPDVEPILVAHVADSLAAIDSDLTAGIRVGTVKLAANMPQPAKQVVITLGFTGTRDYVVKDATATFDVYADSYEDASELALLVAAIAVDVPRDVVKRAEVTLGPVRLSDEGPQEKRSFTLELAVKGSDF